MPTLPDIGKDNLNFNYQTWGSKDNSILLLHGLASNIHIWDLVAPKLSIQNQIIAIDQRGHGETDKPDIGYDFQTIAKDTISIIKHLNLSNPIIIGHSWGGNVAVEIAAHYPEYTKGICLVDGGLIEISRIPGNSLKKALINMAPPVWDGVYKNDIISRLNRRDWGEQDKTSKEANLTEIALSNFSISKSGEVNSRLSRQNHMKIIEEIWKHKPSKLLKMIKCPTLILNARNQDSESSPYYEIRKSLISEALNTIPKVENIWLEDSIHDVPLQRPELVSDIIQTHIDNKFF